MSVHLLLLAMAAGKAVELIGGSFSTDLSISVVDCRYQLTSGGLERADSAGSLFTVGTWLLAGAASDYECRMTMQSGTNFLGDALATWLSLSSTREWLSRDTTIAGGAVIGVGLIEIRRVGGTNAIASATVQLSANRSSGG